MTFATPELAKLTEFGAESPTNDDLEMASKNTSHALGNCSTPPVKEGRACDERSEIDQVWLHVTEPSTRLIKTMPSALRHEDECQATISLRNNATSSCEPKDVGRRSLSNLQQIRRLPRLRASLPDILSVKQYCLSGVDYLPYPPIIVLQRHFASRLG